MSVEKESLFSFEVAVKTVFLKRAVVCRVPAVVIRLLEYPALELKLVTDDELSNIKELLENDRESLAESPQISQLQHSTGTYCFTQGKSCMIKVKLSDLKESLSSIPVYVMVVDVLPDVPKLVASFALSLESAMRRIVRDVSINGIETPCAQGERDIFPLYNLMGSKVGEVEMGVRVSSLGINMIQHVSKIVKPMSNLQGDNVLVKSNNLQRTVVSVNPPMSATDGCNSETKIKTPKSINHNDDKENVAARKKLIVSKSTQTAKPKMPSKSIQYPVKGEADALVSTENVFCPPALYYDHQSDAMERDLHLKQQKALTHQLDSIDQSIRLTDLTSDSKLIEPLPVVYRSQQQHKKTFAAGDKTQDIENTQNNAFPQSLSDFPILSALVAEVRRLGLGEEETGVTQSFSKPVAQKEERTSTKDKPAAIKARKQVSPLHKTPKKQRENKGPLKFGMTNTMRLRMAITKATLERQQKDSQLKASHTQNSLRQSPFTALGRTYVKSSALRGGRRVRMVSTACGPDDSMYRRDIPKNIREQTVYMGRVAGYEEATDQDVPSMGHMTSDSPAVQEKPSRENEFGIEDLMIVKDIGTPRAHSRQSQRSIEIHLPTASTEFTIGRDDDWRSTVSDQEKLIERLRAAEEVAKYDEPDFYTPPESTDTSRPPSATEIHAAKKDQRVRMSEGIEKLSHSEASASDRYRYSDDFDDDKTWSANRTPSAMTPVNSTAIKEEDEEEYAPVRPSKSMDSTITATRTSDFESTTAEDVVKPQEELRSASAQKIASSDDAVETSSVGSVMTALISAKSGSSKGKMKVGSKMVPEPIPSDSPVIQSINTESASVENFPEPKKLSLTSKSLQHKKKSSSKNIHLPKTIEETGMPKKDAPLPKQSRFTPSPPSTRRFSPVSSPESSKERIRRMFHHPGRRTRPTSSGSASSDFEKPLGPVRRSDSVSSYQPSDISEMSNVRLSEDLDNLSDILSENTDSQDTTRFRRHDKLPSDGPKTYFGKPKLDPETKLGYTT